MGGKKDKKAKKGHNGTRTGTSQGCTPPPSTDTANILTQTRQMMDSSPASVNPSGSQNEHYCANNTPPNAYNRHGQIPVCSTNDMNGGPSYVNNTPCVTTMDSYIELNQPQQIPLDQAHHPNLQPYLIPPQTVAMSQQSSGFHTDSSACQIQGGYAKTGDQTASHYAAPLPPQPLNQNSGSHTDPNQGKIQGNYSMTGDQRIATTFPPPPLPPPQYSSVIYNMIKGLEQTLGQRLFQIENNLQGQNKRWEHVELQLENQNTRMSNIEQQLSQMSGMKQALSNTNSRVMKLGDEVSNLKTQVETYDQSINSYSEQYDEIISFNTESDSKMTDLLKRVDDLEIQQAKSEDKLIEVQWRSMRENLIFTGIDEPNLHGGENENVELTLKGFLRDGMKIERPIEFDRVHRLGRYDIDRKYPRPIIAKFERFKEKEYVRQTAPDALYGTKYGVREQYPQEIEEKRKLLYPEAKKARQNKDNKVRLVRDKLYVNGKEVTMETNSKDNSYKMKYPPGRERE